MPAKRGAQYEAEPDDVEGAHEEYFQELNDGCGCAEIWEYLSERRRERSDEADGE